MKTPDSLMAWLDPSWMRPKHIRYMGEVLSRVRQGNQRIILQCSVRHAKSWTASHGLPAWFLELDPRHLVGMATYQANFSARWGRRVRNTFSEYQGKLRTRIAGDSSAAHSWETTLGGGMHTAGVGGELTGRGFHLMIMDDPIKNWEEANSELQRDNAWDWYQTTFRTRLEPNGSIVVIMARWHEDDLTGRLLKAAEEGGEQWDVIDLPALAVAGDQLGRKPGEALWPERYSAEVLEETRAAVGKRAWQALYQQNPRPEEGNRYKREWFRYAKQDGAYWLLPQDDGTSLRVHESDIEWYSMSDLAQTAKTESDYTVRLIFGVTRNRRDVIVRDIYRAQADSPTVTRVLRGDIERFNLRQVCIEDTHWGKTLIQQMQADGIAVKPVRVGTQDKVARSMVSEDMMEAGKVFFMQGMPHLDDFENELLAFPNGAHDDCVDGLSGMAKVVSMLSQPGLIFAEFKDYPFAEGGNIVPNLKALPPDSKAWVLVQPGSTTGVLLGTVDTEENLVVIDELYEPSLDAATLAVKLTGMMARYGIDRKRDLRAQLIDPDAVYMRQKEIGVTAHELGRYGWSCSPWLEREKEAANSRVRVLFRDRKLLLCERCRHLRDELSHYRRKLDRDGLPVDGAYIGMSYLVNPLSAFVGLSPTYGTANITRTSRRG